MQELQMFVPMALQGLRVTLGVFAATLLVSLALSLPVALLRLSRSRALRSITAFYIYLMRGTPLLLQLMFLFFGYPYIPWIGYSFSREGAVLLAFILNYTAYFAEIFRGGIQSVPAGQWEAGRIIGLSRVNCFFQIIFPQALRMTFPSICNEAITLVKDTSLVYIVGSADILKAARSVSNVYSSFLPYVFVGILYLLIIAALGRGLSRLERRMS